MKISIKHILVLIGMCGLVATSVGLITNVSGLFFTPISEDFGILKGSVSLTLTISNIVFALGGLTAPKLLKESRLKQLLIFGTVCIAGCTALLGLAPNLMIMYVLNAIRGFAGGVLGFVLITMVINNWFYAKAGLFTSIAMSCSGFAGALFSPIVSSIIENTGWRSGYLFVSVMMVILNLPAILFLPSLDPKTKNIMPYGYEEIPEPALAADDPVTTRTVSKSLFIFAILFAFMVSGSTALPQHFPGIAVNFGLDASQGALMLSVCMLMNSMGKIIFGILVDTLGSKKSILTFQILILAAIAGLWFIHAPMFMVIAAGIYGLTYALGAVGNVIVSKDLFGIENYARTYPKVSLAGTVSNAIFSSVIGFMYDFSGNYLSTLVLMFVMVAVYVALILKAYQDK
jgi:MFS family permease